MNTVTPDADKPVLGAGDWFDSDGPALIGSQCSRCHAHSFPPSRFCWRCGSQAASVRLPASGRVLAKSTVRVAPQGFPAMYDVGIVELLPELRILARFDEHAPPHGDPVTVTLGHLRDDAVGKPVFGPVFTAGGTPHRRSTTTDPAVDLDVTPRDRRAEPLGVAVAGAATTPFGRPDLPAEELAAQAALAAVTDAGLQPTEIDAVVAGSAFSTAALGQRMARHVPWGGRRLLNVENACASGTTALAEAAALVRAGMASAVVAVGADTPARSGGGLIGLDLSRPVAGVGVTLPALYALVADLHRSRHGTSVEALAEVVVRSRAAARRNPDAYRREPVTRADVLSSRTIADPLTLLQCTPNADGAAAVVVVADHLRRRLTNPRVELAALTLGSGMPKDRFSEDGIVRRTAQAAFAQARAGPRDVNVVELHDAFAPAALVYLEELGLAEPGTAAHRVLSGGFTGTGDVAFNVGGGLLSRGHPPGATGLAQVTELVRQLRGQAGDRQVPNAEIGLVHTMGGTILELEANACTVGVLKRVT